MIFIFHPFVSLLIRDNTKNSVLLRFSSQMKFIKSVDAILKIIHMIVWSGQCDENIRNYFTKVKTIIRSPTFFSFFL